jgi:hypothetical protein
MYEVRTRNHSYTNIISKTYLVDVSSFTAHWYGGEVVIEGYCLVEKDVQFVYPGQVANPHSFLLE